MPEESVFNDLPEAEVPKEEVTQEVPAVEPPKAEEPKQEDKDAKRLEEIMVKKDKALREAREKAKGLIKKLKEYEARDEEEAEEEEEDMVPSKKIDSKSIAEEVKKSIKDDSYQEQLVGQIKGIPGITKQEAEAILETVKQIPKSGNAQMDVEFAHDYLKKKQQYDKGFASMSPPSMGQGAFIQPRSSGGDVPESVKQFGKQFGNMSDEDYKKFKNLPNL